MRIKQNLLRFMVLCSGGLVLCGVNGVGCGSKTPLLKAVKVTEATVESTVTTTSSGTVEAEQQATLGFSLAGRVAKVAAQVGDHVGKGKILAELENQDLQTVLQEAQNEWKRAHELYDAKLVSVAALDTARKNFEVAKANYEKSLIRAPFDGLVTEVNLEVGELFQPAGYTPNAKRPVHLIDLKPRIVKGNIDEIDLSKVKRGSKARIKILAVRAQPFPAEVHSVVPFVSTTKEQDRTSQIELRITEKNMLIPVGASAEVEVVVQSKDNVLAVPARTVLGSGEHRYVYKLEDNHIQKTPIHVGVGNYERQEILSGLAKGDVVVFPAENVDLTDDMKVKSEVQPWP